MVSVLTRAAGAAARRRAGGSAPTGARQLAGGASHSAARCMLRARGACSAPVSMGMANPTPLKPPRPEGSAIAVLIPIRRPLLSSSTPPALKWNGARLTAPRCKTKPGRKQGARQQGAARLVRPQQAHASTLLLAGSQHTAGAASSGRRSIHRSRPELPGLMAASVCRAAWRGVSKASRCATQGGAAARRFPTDQVVVAVCAALSASLVQVELGHPPG